MTQPSGQSTSDATDVWQKRAERERRAREAAENLLEEKSEELFTAYIDLARAKAVLEQQLYELENERDRVLLASRTDSLTSVENRGAFLADMTTLFASPYAEGQQLWMYLLDIRRFKQINASFGQSTGDLLLRQISRELQELSAPYNGKVARFAGTEFAVLICAEPEKVVEFTETLWQRIQRPFRAGAFDGMLDVALGAAGTNLSFRSAEEMHDAADFALGISRKSGRIVLFDDIHQKQIANVRELENRLRRAIERYVIEPWFQPVIHIQEENAISLEVLARWPEDGGFVSPAEFIPVAEEIGLRRQLDRWVIRSAFQNAREWVKSGKIRDVSINIPPSDLMSAQFVKDLDDLLKETDYPRHCLVLEVTESVFIEDLAFVNQQLERLSRLGVKIALDDFGTGYSNLRSLVGLPLSKIKLDKSLILDMERNHKVAMLVSTFIQWARASDLDIVAEGVENETQAVLLKALGCTCLQGYLYGKAMSAEQINAKYFPEAELCQTGT